ncbi:hypothetical protein [Nocardiopsis sp. NRRL B-16309]|uniref:hypothetical protein n=1 Tax=Nocardiopsis sp. NRRL B-16309 TaxID=1519494 RepID=UPI0006B01EF7|nr:hypothetical protein [Nocardiopsis sp. NRRL B-16309]KOX18057.1 hypothetical protein ADL05_08060 [Nocardiopsis sp. NRRL B-16309]
MFTVGAILCLALFWFVRTKAHWLISGFFAVFGGALFAFSFLGGWASTLILWVLGFILGLLPESISAGSVLAAVAVFFVVMVGIDVWRNKKLDEGGQWAAICLPVVLLAAGGAVGGVGGSVVTSLADAGTGIFGPLLGW